VKEGDIMNDRNLEALASHDGQLIVDALAALQESTGIRGQVLPNDRCPGLRISLDIAGTSLQYGCEVKPNIDRFLTLEDLKARSVIDQSTVLVCPVLTSALAARCHQLDIQFIDTAGNAYISNRSGIFVNVTGRKHEKALRESRGATITPAALRIVFGILAKPSLLNAPYRDISFAVQVSTGAIAKAFETLETSGFIGTTPSGTRLIRSPDLLLSEWATGFMHRIRPKLKKFRFTSPDPDDLREWNPELRMSAWGGEMAAELITQHLKPASFTIYMDMDQSRNLSDLVKDFRLRADPHGSIEVIQPFWNMDEFADSFPTVPWHLVYADLLGSKDSRNLQVAELIFRKVVSRVQESS
jgi:hypothetical protein